MRLLFDLDLHGEDKLREAVRRMPVNSEITLLGSRLTLRSMPTAPRRFNIVAGPRVQFKPHVDVHRLNSPTTAVDELLKAHNELLAA